MLEKYKRENFIFSNIENFGSKPNLLHTKHFMKHLKDSDQIFYLSLTYFENFNNTSTLRSILPQFLRDLSKDTRKLFIKTRCHI